MADAKQVELLTQDVDAWNRWREENPQLHPDLSGANLRDTDLIESRKIK